MRSIQYKHQIAAISLLTLLCLGAQAAQSVHAAGSTPAVAEAFHIAKQNQVSAGALVSTVTSSQQTIELATTKNAARLVGIADPYPLVALSGHEDGANIVLSGTAYALVSDINGPVGASDRITASPIAGVGMRATTDTQVIGIALAAPTGVQRRTIRDSHGTQRTVHIGSVPLQVGAAFYQAPGSNVLPPFVQRVANAIAGRTVSLTRIIVCSLLLLLSCIGITALVYTATRSAMISLGRNPLAAHDIRGSLYQVIAVAGAVAVVTLIAAYLILAL